MTKYKVVGAQPVLDHAPGEEFSADLPDDQEAFLLEIGALEKASGGSGKKERASTKDTKDSSETSGGDG